MIRLFLILFISTTLVGCYANKHKIQTLPYHKIEKVSSYSSKYLIANYSISKGDFKTVNEILNNDFNSNELLKFNFFSNLVSGNFSTANKISNIITTDKKNNYLYLLPEYILNIKNNKFEENLKISEDKEIFFDFKKLDYLIKLWFQNKESKSSFDFDKRLENTTLHELLILENFYDNSKLNKIADYIYYNKLLNYNDYLFLAGLYFRQNNLEKFNEIIKTKISNQFNKKLITQNFFLKNDTFSQTPKLSVILSAKLYNIAIENNRDGDKSKGLQKFY